MSAIERAAECVDVEVSDLLRLYQNNPKTFGRLLDQIPAHEFKVFCSWAKDQPPVSS